MRNERIPMKFKMKTRGMNSLFLVFVKPIKVMPISSGMGEAIIM